MVKVECGYSGWATTERAPGKPLYAYDQFLRTSKIHPYDSAKELAVRLGVSERTVVRYRKRQREQTASQAGRYRRIS